MNLKLISALLLALLLAGEAAAAVLAAERKPARPRSQVHEIVTGELLGVEGRFAVVKDSAGNELRLAIMNDTKLRGPFKAGGKVEARVATDGHAISITAVKGSR
jgi:hypothetical protein